MLVSTEISQNWSSLRGSQIHLKIRDISKTVHDRDIVTNKKSYAFY